MRRLFLFAALIWAACAAAFAAPYDCTGQVVDEQNEPLVGALVQITAPKQTSTVTDIDGRFSIKVPDGAKTIEISYVGFKNYSTKPARNLGVIVLETSSVVLNDVVITQSIGKTRETPVAMSTIDAEDIQLKVGAQEFMELLKTTPGVYTIRQGGGFGDAETRMRGFKSENVAMMVNGIPINDMEWGGVYQSNWAGLSDVASNIQTQRGLGATIVSTPSVGGTINITTRTIDVEKGGSVWYGMGNDAMNMFGLKVSTGLMKNGWAMTLLGSRKWGDGYVQGTPFNSYNYFFNLSKRINDKHQVSITAFGAPQTHFQRSKYDGLNILAWQSVKNYMDGESMYRYNPTFGYDRHGKMLSTNYNVYHKPQISLNHIWQINETSSLSSALYMSIASGYGLRGETHSAYSGAWYGADSSTGDLNMRFRNPDGTFDYAAIQDINAASTDGSQMVISRSVNNHEWYGLVSSYKKEFNQRNGNRLNLTAGLDLRYYIGHHKNTIDNLMDGAYYIDPYRSNKVMTTALNAASGTPEFKYKKLGVGDVVYRNYNGYTAQEGVYAQGEYTMLDKRLNIVVSGALNNNTYWRREFFYADKDHEKSATKNFIGGTIKGGVNYNFDRHNNAFFNLGYISRAPFFSRGVFLNSTNSNVVNPNAKNEKVYSFEAGYGYHSRQLAVTVNAYYTKWIDKTTSKMVDLTDGTRGSFSMEGVDARHMGIELNATYIPATWVEIEGMLSIGDWEWASNPTGYFFGEGGLPIAALDGTPATSSADHMHATLEQKGVKVGGSAQTTASIGVNFKPFKGFRIGGDWTVAARNYSDLNITADQIPSTNNGVLKAGTPWEMPWGQMLDLNASYTFDIAGLKTTVFGNVNNLFNYNYITQSYTPVGKVGTWENAYQAFYSLGRTWSIRMRVNF